MANSETLLLTGNDVRELLNLVDCISAVERAFRLHGEEKAPPPGVLGVHARDGGFHIKAGILPLGRNYFAAKANANFPGNMGRGMPTIQGVVLLFDADNGQVLAVMDSIEITTLRTGAATAVAAKYLARRDSRVATICGCGNQGRVQLRAVRQACAIEKVFAWDIREKAAEQFAAELGAEMNIQVSSTKDLAHALQASDVCISCTPARKFFIRAEDVPAGMFIAAVGADNEDKQELDPALLAPRNKVVADVRPQCAAIGDLHHAIAAGTATAAGIHAELGEIVCGKKPGRTNAEEITIFDSTGMALQDVAAAACVYEKAVNTGKGTSISLAAPH
ncbi:MAG TPA: ornithine cyclodeaminase family protein [Candidatus Angelobacter sp.]|nr:ornithine cyclodeaminase family protein [Candidatus Angelobacter sp.]